MRKILFLLLMIIAFGLRLYRINYPLADWHSWRQADTATVSRNFLKHDFDLLRPRFDDLSEVASGLKNPQGYRFVEFPVYNLIHAALAKYLPVLNLVVWGRLISIVFSLGAIIWLYLIVRDLLGEGIAWLVALTMAVLPFSIYYSRVILPEPMMIFSSLGMVYCFLRWLTPNHQEKEQNRKIWYLISAVGLGVISLLLKPYVLVLYMPIVYLAVKNLKFDWRRYVIFGVSLVVMVLPLVAWRVWMRQYPEGIPDYSWLLNKTGIRLKGAWFYWLFAERLVKLILGYWGIILLGTGLAVKTTKKEGLFFHLWALSILVYMVVVADGNVRHDYYQVFTVPIISVFLAKGIHFWLRSPPPLSRFFTYPILVVTLLFTLAFSWYQVRDYFNINNQAIIEAGKVADSLLPKEAKVMAPYGGDTAFLYQINRQGWPVILDFEKQLEAGATHLVSVNIDEITQWAMINYCPLVKTNQYVIIDLTKSCPSAS